MIEVKHFMDPVEPGDGLRIWVHAPANRRGRSPTASMACHSLIPSDPLRDGCSNRIRPIPFFAGLAKIADNAWCAADALLPQRGTQLGARGCIAVLSPGGNPQITVTRMHDSARKVVAPGERIPEFEGLRGCLAWWVVLFHLYLHAGMTDGMRSRSEFWVGYGWAAVPLFIMLSGYVITVLIENQREPYGVFITRRFFRLAPVYYLLTLYGAALALHADTYGHALGWHVLMHLTMLQGVLPNQVLPNSAISLVHPAWSISVEWQFYVIAPLVLWFCRRSAARCLVLIGATLAVSKYLTRHYDFPFEATVAMRGGLFAVGIFSYYITRWAVANPTHVRRLVPFMIPLALAAVWVVGGEYLGPGLVWVVVFASVLARLVGAPSILTRPAQFLLTRRSVIWLGRVSYSTYLCHNFVLSMVEGVMGSSFTSMNERHRVIVLILVGCPLIAGFSALLFYFVEQPGIRLGKRLVAAWQPRSARAAPAPSVAAEVER